MLRLAPPGRARLEQAETLTLHVAGSESNVAVALARMGLRARWVSRLPDDGRGRRVVRSLAAHGVDVSYVRWESGARVGVFFVEFGAAPRPTSVLYDRADSAAAHLSPEDLPEDLLADSRHLHVTGITPALSPTCAAAVTHAVVTAKRLGRTVSLDVNYRARLWPAARAAATLLPFLAHVDLLITSAEDARLLFGVSGTGTEAASILRKRFGTPAVAVTLPAGGAVVDDGTTTTSVAALPVEIVDRLGAGDAFAAGLLTAYLEDGDLARGARLGMALCALKLTTPGDELFFTRAEAEALASEGIAANLTR
jgi:2-dehydro-3-deoxygluconokinase